MKVWLGSTCMGTDALAHSFLSVRVVLIPDTFSMQKSSFTLVCVCWFVFIINKSIRNKFKNACTCDHFDCSINLIHPNLSYFPIPHHLHSLCVMTPFQYHTWPPRLQTGLGSPLFSVLVTKQIFSTGIIHLCKWDFL